MSEFQEVQSRLSNHFDYTLTKGQARSVFNCKKFSFQIEGKARDLLRIKDANRAFLKGAHGLPNSLSELSFNRVRDERLNELRTRGIREECLETKDYECMKYKFRDPSESEILGAIQKLDDEFPTLLKSGMSLINHIQVTTCPGLKKEISYLEQLP